MSLQFKVISWILAVFMGYGAFDYAAQRLFILPSFQTLEREESLKNMDRTTEAIDREIAALAQPAADWASWDDAYQFVRDRNKAFQKANLGKEAMKNLLKINLLYFFTVAGKVVWGETYDRRTDEAVVLPEFSGGGLPADHPLIALPEADSETKGVMITVRGPMLVVAKPILTSASEGPARGAVVFGRFLDAAAIAEQARVNLTVLVLKNGELGPEQAAVAAELGATGGSVVRASEGENRVYRILPDIFGQPALLLQVAVPRAISASGEAAIRYTLLSLLGAGLVILGVLVVGLRHMVLTPIHRLTRHAVNVGQRDDLTARLDLERRDEIGVLAHEFDRMVERLATTRRALVEQSHQSGIAEMASGVLHNIGNAVTPLKVRVANLESALRELPAAELRMALTELANSNTPPDRRADLEQFMDLAAREIAAALDQTTTQVVAIARQVEHVHKILGDQERFSRAARILEPVSVADVARESVDLLGDDLRREFQVELDVSLTAAGPVLGSRVAVQQILVNLLKNAVEALRERSAPPGTGRITLDARPEFSDGRAMVRLCVTDNGIGISPEILPRVFERGFSTKSRSSSGLGLHWCAVTATALGGRLQAESAGRGQGACLSLSLPQAESQPTSPVAATGD